MILSSKASAIKMYIFHNMYMNNTKTCKTLRSERKRIQACLVLLLIQEECLVIG